MAVDTSYVQSSLELNPRWSAPEVIGSGHYSRAADVYSFGVVLWELLTWQVGWSGRLGFSRLQLGFKGLPLEPHGDVQSAQLWVGWCFGSC
jgi:serine/threonine protein kinase